jgi:signal transduction histidine kinase
MSLQQMLNRGNLIYMTDVLVRQTASPCGRALSKIVRKSRLQFLLQVTIISIASFSYATLLAAESLPRTVLLLDQSLPSAEYFGRFFSSFQATLKVRSDVPPTIYLERLEYSHSQGSEYDNLLLSFIKEKYSSRRIGVIVVNGFDALQFAIRLGTELDPATPIVFSNINDGLANQLNLPPNVTGTTIRRTIRDALVTAKAFIPRLKRLAIVGDPLEQQTYRRHYKNEFSAIDREVELVDLTGLPMNELRSRVAALPKDTAIFYTRLTLGPGDIRYDPNEALELVFEVANGPIVIDQETRLGHGGTGGFILEAAPTGEAIARIVLRLLNGESASSIPVMPGEFVKPIFDARELRRWNVNEARLPLGSEIRFREASVWEQYSLQILAICAALLAQAALIGWLIYEIGRRQRAEIQSRSVMAELTSMNRRAAAGQLSASIAHEVIQPLTAITTRASTTLRLLAAETLDLDKIRGALTQIESAGHRAGDIISSVRAMFKKDTPNRAPTDINRIILTVLSIVRVELQKHGVELQTQLTDHLPNVNGDKVQLQQVILNLVMNGIEAMHSVRHRVLKVETTHTEPGVVRVSIEDTGTGIDPCNLNRIFKPLFTTKDTGMGMGLAICQSIVESHRGRIWISQAINRGSIFQFELPINTA